MNRLASLRNSLRSASKIKDLSKLREILRVKVRRDRINRNLTIS